MSNYYGECKTPNDVPEGMLFIWRGKTWRRGRGIIYRAKPCTSGIIYESYLRRQKRRGRIVRELINSRR